MNRTIFCILLMLQACSTLPRPVAPGAPSGQEKLSIFVVSHGWHTGIIIKSDLLFKAIPELKERFLDSRFLEIGWGDASFYQAKEITLDLKLRASFVPTSSIVHVVGFSAEPARFFNQSEVKQVIINKAHAHTMINFISRSFKRDADGRLRKLKTGIYGESQFYEGTGSYYLFNTCNKWTAKALVSGGLDLLPMFKFTASSVMNAVQDASRE